MRSLTLPAGLAAMLALAGPLPAQDPPPDFTGRWRWDQSQSRGVASGAPQIAPTRATRNSTRPGSTERGRGATPGIESTVPGAQREGTEQTQEIRVNNGVLEINQVTNGVRERFRFNLAGTEVENDFFPPRAPEAVKLRTTSRWEGPVLVTEGSGSQRTQAGTILVTVTERRSLGEDGRTMVVEQSIVSTGGRPLERRLVYVRQ